MYLNDENIDFSAYMQETDHQQKIKPAKLWVEQLEEDLLFGLELMAAVRA